MCNNITLLHFARATLHRFQFFIISFDKFSDKSDKLFMTLKLFPGGCCNILIHVIPTSWASCQIRKIPCCACVGNAGNIFPATAVWRSRHESQHVRDARAVIRKIPCCACVGNAGNIFPATAVWRSRHESRHVRDALDVMHSDIAN